MQVDAGERQEDRLYEQGQDDHPQANVERLKAQHDQKPTSISQEERHSEEKEDQQPDAPY